MNIHKLIKKTEDFVSGAERNRKKKRKYLKQIIRKLKKHERALREQLETSPDKSIKGKIEQEIALAHAQRKKGLKNLKALKKVAKSK